MWLTGNETKQAKCDKPFGFLFRARMRDSLSLALCDLCEVHPKLIRLEPLTFYVGIHFFEPLKLVLRQPAFVGHGNQENVRPITNVQLTNSQQTAAPIARMTAKSNYKML